MVIYCPHQPPVMGMQPRDTRTTLVIAALGGIVLAGIGHLYIGYFKRGAVLIGLSMLVWVGTSISLVLSDVVLVVVAILGVLLYAFQLYDVYTIQTTGKAPG